MNFIDALTIDYRSKEFNPRKLIACIMYLIIGGKDIMCAFQMEYHEMEGQFMTQFPIVKLDSPTPKRLPEGVLFYN